MIEILKLVVLFFLVFIVMRFLGKSLLSQWTPYDLVTIIFLSYAGLGTIQFDGFHYSVISILVIGIIYIFMSRLSLFQAWNPYIVGEPTILIHDGKIVKENLKKTKYSLTELLSSIRLSGYPDVNDIDYAILEPNGDVSIIPKKDMSPLTAKDVEIERVHKGIPIAVVIEGKIQAKNLQLINKTEKWLQDELLQKGYADLNKIFYAYVNDQDQSLTIDTEMIRS
ncbi:DUF421 domain-containing protein [Anaerobacillus sp. MEB173]|uniref:DUF421 domain-containing protein n=1 Tax=Anaerobacillus sp. MEB173 TaxID=3383345 RepID=UPI003F910F6A